MARYIDADALHEIINKGVGTPALKLFADCCVELAPTADVVPKSEVEEWKAEAIHYQGLLCQAEIELNQAKQEVAREIFEEIDEELNFLKRAYPLNPITRHIIYVFAKLKKKYTESEDTV